MVVFPLLGALAAMPADPPFEGTIARTAAESKPAWPRQNSAPADAPNIVIILLDDIGFADTSTFGGIAETPALDRLAANGLRYNNFNVTAMCSPTRAALLTGRNHHRVGYGIITEGANGYPGYNSYWKENTASVAEVLKGNGYRTAAFGKWHNTPEWEITSAGPYDRWPTGLGFEHFYGFMGAEDNHWEPSRLYRDTTAIEGNQSADSAYHLTTDITDQAIGWIREHRSYSPDKPYFLYFATGAVHTPHHAPKDWIERYRGKFDHGWDVLRQEIFDRQKRLGVIPPDAELTPRPSRIPAWDSLSEDEQRLFARQMEVYAAFVAHTDYEVGRLLQEIAETPGGRENTLVFYIVGDNGAVGRRLPGYGGDATLAEELARIDELGGPMVPFNQYQGGWGWMGNTPFQYWKTVASHFGGLRAPLIVSWPKKIADQGGLRQQFQHVTDIVPTIYDVVGIEPPKEIDGIAQQPMDGRSIAATWASADLPSAHETQYFELSGSRAIYHKGWMASALSGFMSPSGDPDRWELYHVAQDFSQARNIASKYPEKLAELQALFDREASVNGVYPIGGAAWDPGAKPFAMRNRKRFDYYQGAARIPWAQIPDFTRSFSLEAVVSLPDEGAQGVLATFGYRNKGFAWFVKDGRLQFESREGVQSDILVSDRPLPTGATRLRFEFDCETCEGAGRSRVPVAGTARMWIGSELVAQQRLAKVDLINSGEAFAFYMGLTGGSRISDAFDAPFPFTGRLERLTIEVDGGAGAKSSN
ncbi:arylsulfatase [Altererythrobacter sp. BO-6]|uniref:arylsulfatase n=1 Tax=Altererythrobacter sp. BO-6 TaxID=2604537 RepID=UPI0019CFA8BF|nr:arylsulfatase [Altererythrobacter sp. BO-6]